jgi:hypothetical protein
MLGRKFNRNTGLDAEWPMKYQGGYPSFLAYIIDAKKKIYGTEQWPSSSQKVASRSQQCESHVIEVPGQGQ